MDWGIIGHEWAAELLRQHIAQGTMRHAYLFCGPPGVGRRTLALRFAQAINCTQPPAPGEPCGSCRTCQQMERMQHADLSVVQPEPDASTLKVDQIRDLMHTLSLSPYQARFRVALLLNFETATPSAQNALLKTLEEAPEKAVLLLTSDSPDNLLPTIVSRCEVLRLRPLAVGDLSTALQSRCGLSAEEAENLAHLSGGRPGTARRLHEDPKLVEQRESWLNDLENLLVSSRVERFKYAEKITKSETRDKEKIRQIFYTWLTFWRDVLLRSAGAQVPLTNHSRAEKISAYANRISVETARLRLNDLEKALDGLDANLNVRLMVEVLLLDLPHLPAVQ